MKDNTTAMLAGGGRVRQGLWGTRLERQLRDRSRKIRKNKQTKETAVRPSKDLGVYPRQDEKSWRTGAGGMT